MSCIAIVMPHAARAVARTRARARRRRLPEHRAEPDPQHQQDHDAHADRDQRAAADRHDRRVGIRDGAGAVGVGLPLRAGRSEGIARRAAVVASGLVKQRRSACANSTAVS